MLRKPSAKRLQAVAYHEAGHAVALHFLKLEFEQVTIIADGEALGLCSSKELPGWLEDILDLGDIGLPEDEEDVARGAEKEVIATLAGSIAEKQFCVRANWVGAQNDRNTCNIIANLKCKSDSEAKAYLRWLRIRTANLVKSEDWQHAIPLVAKELLDRKSLTQEEVRSTLYEAVPQSQDEMAEYSEAVASSFVCDDQRNRNVR